MAYTDEENDTYEEENNIGHALLITGAVCGVTYAKNYLLKQPCRTSVLTGWKWVVEILNGNPTRCYENFRMDKFIFVQLCDLLKNNYGLVDGRKCRVEEQVAIFLWIVGHDQGNRDAQERFQHSGQTIHKYFHRVLDAITKMSIDWIKPQPRRRVHPYIRNNPIYFPYFKDCIGAIDGTHIKAPLPKEMQARFIGRKGYPTQNILVVCDFDMCFTFCLPGWEGSAHDTRIFLDTVRNVACNFPKPQRDEFYLVDSGYPNRTGYLAPYKGERYHLQEFNGSQPARNAEEVFNYVHSSLRSVIERSFGVWKARWPMIKDIPVNYKFSDQVKMVCATMAIHNFIRRTGLRDVAFTAYDMHPDYVPEDETTIGSVDGHEARNENDDCEMNQKRNNICRLINLY